MNELIVLDNQLDFKPIIKMVVDGLQSAHSKVAYAHALEEFANWYKSTHQQGLSKAVIQSYKAELAASGLAASSINVRLAAIRKLVNEASDNGFIGQDVATAIGKVKGVKTLGVRTGNWLTKEKAQSILNNIDTSTLKGLRDKAIMAIALTCGLRRSEIANLKTSDIQLRDERWCIVDIKGKGGRIRTVPMVAGAKKAINDWINAAYLGGGYVFRAIRRGGHVVSGGMTAQAVHDVIKFYSGAAPHDMRRTFAKMAHKGGAAIEQIQLTLGHSTIQTTERYLGVEQNLTSAPCDLIGILI